MEKFYFTLAGLKEIEKEKEILLSLKKEKMKGDMPETIYSQEVNAEYLTYLEDNDLLNVKINDLDYILKHAEIIKPPSENNQNKIALGAKVFLESGKDQNEFEIVNTFEAKPEKGKISSDSAMGKSLLGHQIGEQVKLSNSSEKYKIKKISYYHLG